MIKIYLITNLINNKKYVGQTIQSIKKRWQRHCWKSTLVKNDYPIRNAINKYGKENFSIKQIDEALSLEEANEKEVYWGNYYNVISPNGYSLKLGGRRHTHFSEETKLKISKSNKGKKASPETIQRLSDSHKGIKPTEETKLKISNHFKGKKSHENTNTAASQKNCKKYLFMSPEGIEIEIVNMKIFCHNNKLTHGLMIDLIKGRRKEYKGWQFIKDLGFMRSKLGSRRNKLNN